MRNQVFYILVVIWLKGSICLGQNSKYHGEIDSQLSKIGVNLKKNHEKINGQLVEIKQSMMEHLAKLNNHEDRIKALERKGYKVDSIIQGIKTSITNLDQRISCIENIQQTIDKQKVLLDSQINISNHQQTLLYILYNNLPAQERAKISKAADNYFLIFLENLSTTDSDSIKNHTIPKKQPPSLALKSEWLAHFTYYNSKNVQAGFYRQFSQTSNISFGGSIGYDGNFENKGLNILPSILFKTTKPVAFFLEGGYTVGPGKWHVGGGFLILMNDGGVGLLFNSQYKFGLLLTYRFH